MPVQYTIHFTLESSSPSSGLPTAGSFFYDAATHQFTNFLVQWAGVQFDLTSTANNPTYTGTSGNYISTYSRYGSANGQFLGINGVSADGSGGVWIADSGGNRVQQLNSSGVYEYQIGTVGNGPGQLQGPAAVALAGK